MFQQGAFTIDPNTTPEQLKRKREQISRMVSGAPARYAGEGLTDLAGGILAMVKNRQMDNLEQNKTAEASDIFDFAMSGQPTSSVPPSMPAGDNASFIRDGLIKRGLPAHVADAFVVNMRDESGLNPGINEHSPLVPGSRGGRGLYQLTGPRRNAFEAKYGENGYSVDNQLDFLMEELRGTESAAARKILAAPDTATAAQAIVNDFLRPSEEHRRRRSQQYANLSSALANPWLSGAQRDALQGLLAQNQAQDRLDEQRAYDERIREQEYLRQQSDPLRQIQIETARATLDNLQNPPAKPQYRQVSGADLGMTGAAGGRIFNVSPDGKISQVGGAETNINVNTGEAAPRMGTIPQGYTAIEDPANPSGYRMVAIPGGPEDTTHADQEKRSARDTASQNVITAAARAREAAGNRNFGAAGTSIVGMLPWTDSAEVMRQVQVLKDITSAESLNAMRRQSPTGGALGSVTEGELGLLSRQGGALDPDSPNFERDLADYERSILRTIHGIEAGDKIFEETRSDATGSLEAVAPPPQGGMPADGSFEAFAANPSAQRAAQANGVTLEDMWKVYKGLN